MRVRSPVFVTVSVESLPKPALSYWMLEEFSERVLFQLWVPELLSESTVKKQSKTLRNKRFKALKHN